MTLLETPEAPALLADGVLSSDQLAELADRFEPFLERCLPLFQRAEQRGHARHLLLGKLSNLSRKTCEPIAHLFQLRRELAEVVVAHGQRYWTEASFHDGKREVGLDEHEVRGWVG